LTTIAYRAGILAADTQLTLSGCIRVPCSKITLIPTKGAVAVSGNVGHEWWFLDWLRGGAKTHNYPFDKAKKFEAIWVDSWNDPWYFSGGGPDRLLIEHKFHAIGEGWQLAMAAMHTGMNAVDAVLFASTLNVNTNNIVDYYNVKTGKVTKGKASKAAA